MLHGENVPVGPVEVIRDERDLFVELIRYYREPNFPVGATASMPGIGAAVSSCSA